MDHYLIFFCTGYQCGYTPTLLADVPDSSLLVIVISSLQDVRSK
jgi:hypothetical protein